MGLQENLRNEKVDSLELRKAITVGPSETVGTVVQLMRDNDIGCAIMTDENKKAIGIFTESMVVELLSHGGLPWNDPIEKHMSERCPWVRKTDPIADVVDAMEMKNTRLLCVVDEHDTVVGVTGQRGVMEYVAEHFPGQVMVQRIGQTPYLSDREGA